MDDLVIFNEFWTKMLALHSGDNENIKAILAEINKFRDFAKKANEINAVVRQLDGFEGAEIKISLGMNGSIHWPADELINKTNAMMSDAVLNLKRQEMVLQRMADAIEGDQLVDGLNLDLITFDGAIPKDNVKLNRGVMVSFNPDTWLEEWQRDVSEFCGIYGIKARFAGIIRRQGAKWHKELLAKGEVRVWNEVRGERFILKYLPKFREALPDIITGEIQIRQIGTTARHDLKKALEKTR